MNKSIIILTFLCITLLFASCSAPVVKTDTPAAPAETGTPATSDTTPAPGAGSNTAAQGADQGAPAGQTVPSASAAAAQQDIASTGQNPPNAGQDGAVKQDTGGLTLEGIKKEAIAAGYKAEDGEVRPSLEPPPIAMIFVNYEDEYMMAQAPVYEFKSAEDALAFAKDVNESGYSLSIVNGKYLAPVAAKYGVIENDKELALLEKLLQSKVMEYPEPIPAALVPSKDYAGAFKQLDTIRGVMNRIITKAVLLYGKTRPPEEALNIASLSFSPAPSGDLSFTAPLSEDQAAIDSVQKVWERFGCTEFEIKHDAAHNYVLSGKRAGVDEKFMIACVYDPATQALRLVETDESGAAREYFEYVPLGADKYAFQTLYDRALVEYKDGKVFSLIFSRKDSGDSEPYDPDKESIYPNGSRVNEAWASGAGADKSENFITYDGIKLHIATVMFTGERLKMDINAP